MRIIGGLYRGRKIRTLDGADVRPTSDRLRETLFNILAPYLRDARVLDVCAGSGAVGLEALSRGARAVTMIESSRRALAVIEGNLQALDIAASVRLLNRDAIVALRQLEAEAGSKFDLVFFDPPYASGLYASVLSQLASGNLLGEDAVVIAEYHARRPPEPAYGPLRRYREVKQGESALAFYRLD